MQVECYGSNPDSSVGADNWRSGYQAPAVNLPKGGGAIKGIGEKFSANPVTGTGSMSVPSFTSPGCSGFGPRLSLSYDYGAGNGPFGFGWTLALPSVTRKTDKGLPQYLDTKESDVFVLSGAEDLVPVLQVDGQRYADTVSVPGFLIQRYRPRIEGLFARVERWAALLATLAMASGCSNLYFHSEARQKQAETATKAWTDIEHESLFKLERENLNKLVQVELQTQQRLAAAKREYLAAAITGPGPAKEDAAAVTKRSVRSAVLERANRNFTTLIGPRDTYDKRVAAADKLAPLQASVAGLAARLQPLGSPVLGCDDLSGTPLALPAESDKWLATFKGPALVGARDSLASLLRDCTSLRTEEANAGTQPPAGQLRIAINQRNQDRRDLVTQRDAFRVAKAEYEEALKDHAAAEAAAQASASDATVAARVGAAAKRLVTAIAALRGLNNAFADEFIANETLDSIDESLTAIAAGKAGDDAKKGVVFAVQAPALIDRYRAAMAASRKPLVLPLLIRRNAEQLQRDAAAADVRLLEAKLATSERIVQAVNNEAAAMRRAIRELEDAGVLLPAALDEPWAEALFKSSGKAKQLLLSGTARFLDAASRLEGERYSLEYARLAIDHERGLAYAEISVAQWGNLIGTGIGQLEAFAKGGIDKAVLSDIAKIIGLFWIGHGVSK